MEYKWIKKDKKIFVDTGDYHEWSHFGWGDIKTQFYGYMEGYKRSADLLIDDAVNSYNIAIIDTVIFPVCFLYRQYLELAMKNILIYYTTEDSVNAIKLVQHDLIKIWNLIEPYMKEEASSDEIEDIRIAREYVQQFHNLDKSSFTFRYPIDKGLNGVLTKENRINLVVLKESMEELYNFFSGVEGKLGEIKQWKSEMIQEFYYD